MQLFTFMEENGDMCLDSGNVTMLLTYCDSKTKSEHSLGKFKEFEWHWSWRWLSSQIVTPFSLVERYWRFGETRYLHNLSCRKRQQFPPKYHHFSTRPQSNISQKMASSIITVMRISNCRYWSYCNSPKFSRIEWYSLFINIRIQVIIQNTRDQWTLEQYVKYVLIFELFVMMI